MPRPPRLPDAAILAVRDELRASSRTNGAPVTGLALRAELRRRHGTPGGVARIYRLLDAAAPRLSPDADHPAQATLAELERLRTDLQRAIERATLAEHREVSHQDRWATELDRMRLELTALSRLAQRVAPLERQVLAQARDLAAAERRVAQLEAALAAADLPLPDPIEHP